MTGCRSKDDYIVRESEQKTYHLRAYTGPMYVKEYADRLRSVGYTDVREGTEHVYVEEKGTDKWGCCIQCAQEVGRLYSPPLRDVATEGGVG